MAKYNTQGMRRLAALALQHTPSDKPSGGQTVLANIIKERGAPVLAASVSLWCRGEERPKPVMRAVLRQVFGIPEDHWLTNSERKVLDRVLARSEAA